MLYLDSSPEQQTALFRAAHEAGVGSIRLDFTMGAVFGFAADPDYTAVDRVNALARRYRLRVNAGRTGLPFWLADCQYLLGRREEAIATWRRSLTLLEASRAPDHPSFAAPLTNLASVLRSMGHLEEAKQDLERALAIAQEVPQRR